MTSSPLLASLDALLHPHDPAELDRAMTERRRVHLSTDQAAEFAGLVSLDRLNALLNLDALTRGTARLMRNGRDIPIELVTERQRGRMRLSPARVHALARQGVSALYDRIDPHFPRVAALSAALARRWRANVWTNCYLSLVHQSAMSTHYDNHDVLVLQLRGTKRWSCYGVHEPYPVANGSVGAEGPPEWEGVLAPGDILFLPAGDVHRVTVEGEHSLHLTIGIGPPRLSAAVEAIARGWQADSVGRSFVRDIADEGEREQQAEALRSVLHSAADAIDLDGLLADRDRARPAAPTRNFGLGVILDEAMWLAPALHATPELPADGPATVQLDGRPVALDDSQRAVLAMLLARGAVRVGDAIAALAPRDPADMRSAIAALADHCLLLVIED